MRKVSMLDLFPVVMTFYSAVVISYVLQRPMSCPIIVHLVTLESRHLLLNVRPMCSFRYFATGYSKPN